MASTPTTLVRKQLVTQSTSVKRYVSLVRQTIQYIVNNNKILLINLINNRYCFG